MNTQHHPSSQQFITYVFHPQQILILSITKNYVPSIRTAFSFYSFLGVENMTLFLGVENNTKKLQCLKKLFSFCVTILITVFKSVCYWTLS